MNCIGKSGVSRKWFFLFYKEYVVRSHLEYCVVFCHGQERHGHFGQSSLKNHQNDQGAGAHYMWGEKKEKKIFLNGDGKALEKCMLERLWSLRHCRCSKHLWIWPWKACFKWTCFEEVVGLAGHAGSSQLTWFYIAHRTHEQWRKMVKILNPVFRIRDLKAFNLPIFVYSSTFLLGFKNRQNLLLKDVILHWLE